MESRLVRRPGTTVVCHAGRCLRGDAGVVDQMSTVPCSPSIADRPSRRPRPRRRIGAGMPSRLELVAPRRCRRSSRRRCGPPLQRLRDRGPDASGSAGDQCDACMWWFLRWVLVKSRHPAEAKRREPTDWALAPSRRTLYPKAVPGSRRARPGGRMRAALSAPRTSHAHSPADAQRGEPRCVGRFIS